MDGPIQLGKPCLKHFSIMASRWLLQKRRSRNINSLEAQLAFLSKISPVTGMTNYQTGMTGQP